MTRNSTFPYARWAAATLAVLAAVGQPLAQGGRAVFYDVSATGTLSGIVAYNWQDTWHQIIPGNFGGSTHTDLLFYNRRGEAKFFTTDGKGGITSLAAYTGWRTTWDIIVPGEFGGTTGTDLLFYDARNQLARFYSVAAGSLTLLAQHTGWADWDVILPMRIGGSSHTDLFFYSRTRGEAKFYHTDGMGNITLVKQYQFQKTWDAIVPGYFDGDGYTDLMFYRRIIGDAKFYAVDNKADLKLLTSYVGLTKSWDMIVPGNFGGNTQTDLLCYDRTAGQIRMALVSNGVMTFQAKRAIGKSWHRMVPGYFNGVSTEDVLCYDFTQRLRIHAVRCTDTNGGRATAITPAEVQTWIDRANIVYATAGIQFDFDPETEWLVEADDVLNRLDICDNFSTKQLCDASANRATNFAATIPCKIVVFFRWGNLTRATGNGFSNPAGNYVAMPGFNNTTTTRYYQDPNNPLHGVGVQNIKLLAHELGHYLGASHTFPPGLSYTNYTDPHKAVLDFMQATSRRTLEDMDGDRHVLYDTPPDLHVNYYLMNGWNPADLFQEIRIYSQTLNIDFTVNPDRHNVMSYFGLCDDYIRMTPDQTRRIREWIHEPHRAKLLQTCSFPGLIKPFGSSCRTGMTHSATGDSGLGNAVTYRINKGPIGQVAALMIGLSRTTWGSIKLPLHLNIIGMPNCYAYQDQLAVVRSLTDKSGNAAFPFTVPKDTSLIGIHVYTQCYCIDPGANSTGVTVTNALDTRIGG